MDFNQLLEYSKSVNNIWTFFVFVIIVIILGFIFIYNKKPELIDLFFDRISGKKTDENLKEINISIKQLAENIEKVSLRVDKNLEITNNQTADINAKNEKATKEILLKISELYENQKVDIYVADFSKKLYEKYYKFLEDNNVNKNLKDVFQEGIKSSIDFVRIMLTNNGLKSFDTMELSANLKSNFRTLQISNTYNTLKLKNLEKFKLQIEEEIVKPQIDMYLINFVSSQKANQSKELVYDFIDININFSLQIIKQTYRLYKDFA